MTNYYIVGKPNLNNKPLGIRPLKTSQSVVYSTGDDGDTRRGRDVDFFTLSYKNIFGTTDRFTGVNGLTITNSIAIDWSTFDGVKVLGYYYGNTGARSWGNQLNFFNNLTVGGYSGWSLSNVNEFWYLFNWSAGFVNATNYSPLNIPQNVTYWTSTSSSSGVAISTNGGGILISSRSKGSAYMGIGVRYFTINELNLL
jgi:hypothetical protein